MQVINFLLSSGLYITRCCWIFVHHFLRFNQWTNYTVRDANMLVFVTPHQFMDGICKRLVGKLKEDVVAISLIKGMEVKMEGPHMISTLISEQLRVNCCVLMGANIANEVIYQFFEPYQRIRCAFTVYFLNNWRLLGTDCCREVQWSNSWIQRKQRSCRKMGSVV